MPQVLKEEIRERIKRSAVAEFYEKGYKIATMKNIAAHSGIPTGLIYSYYKNKEDLFEKIVSPVCIRLEAILRNRYKPDDPDKNLFEYELPQMLDCIKKYHQELVILIDKSIGSRFSDIKEKLINDVTVHFKEIPVLKNTEYDEIFYHILATNFMEGIFEIARHYVDESWAEDILVLLVKHFLYGVRSLQNK
jgi:AcrR family transcriptional regulator